MDLFAAILIGIAIGIWLAVMVLFFLVHGGWVPPQSGTNIRTRPGRAPATAATGADMAVSSGSDSPHSPIDEDSARTGQRAMSGHRVTYAEVDRASKSDVGVARHLRYLRLQYQGDEEGIMEIIRAAEAMDPQAEVGDWVIAAAQRVESMAGTVS